MRLDAPRCEGCRAVLPRVPVGSIAVGLRGIEIDTGGWWAYRCDCGWEHEPVGDGLPPPLPTWRTIAPELVDEIGRLRLRAVELGGKQ